MRTKILITLSLIFWGVMNLMLLKSEFRPTGEEGSRVPVSLVAEKILTSPDNSTLEIRMGKKRIGIARLYANIAEKEKRRANQEALEGMIREADYYSLDIDGTVNLSTEGGTSYLYYLGMVYDTDLNWEVIRFRLSQRPYIWEFEANSTNKTLLIITRDRENTTTQQYTFEELSKPDKLISDLYGPFLGGILGEAIEPWTNNRTNKVTSLADQVHFEARNAFLEMHGARTRIYKLKLKAFDKYDATLTVSRVGEIIHGDLPMDIQLIYDEF